MPGGRPTVMTKDTVNKLLEGFAMSFTDDEACIYANISKPTLYLYCDSNPKFSNQKELLKKQPNMKAKLNLTKSINNGDKNDSKWWLERKGKDEFSLKKEIEQNTTLDVNFEAKELSDKELDEIINNG